MPRVYAEATFTPTATTAPHHYAEGTLTVGAASGAAWVAEATVTPDQTPYDVATGGYGSDVSLFGMEVWVDGTVVDAINLRGAVTVDRSIDEHTQRGTFSAVHGSLAATSSFARLAPQTCDDAVVIKGVYRAGGSTYRYDLLANGLADSVTSQAVGTEATDSYGIVDGGGRLSRKLVTMILPEGHNLYRERVLRKVLTEAGETDFSFEQGEQRANKGVQLVDANPAEFAAEYMATEHRGFLLGRDGSWKNPTRKSAATSPSVTFTPASIRTPSSFQLIVPGDVVTTAVLTGSEQIVPEGAETCGFRTEQQEIKVTQHYAPIVTKYTQNSTTGALTDWGGSTGDATLRLLRKVIFTRTYYCDTLLHEQTDVYGYYNPENARYEIAAGAKDYLTPVLDEPYMLDGATADDSEPGYAFRAEKWLLISREKIRHYYDKTVDGNSSIYYGSIGPSTDERRSHFQPPAALGSSPKTELEGSKLGTIRTLERYYNPRDAVKTRPDTSTTWESQSLINGTLLTGSGEGITQRQESFKQVEKEWELLFPNANGTLKRRKVFREGYVARPGNLYLYGDGTESRDSSEQFEVFYTEETIYSDNGDGTHSLITTKSGPDGKLLEQEPITTERGLPGAGPAIETLTGFEPDELADLDSEDSAERLDNVDPAEQRPIVATVTSNLGTDNGGCHQPYTLKTSIPWAENVGELTNLGRLMIEESAAFAVQFQTLPWWSGDEGEKIHVTFPPLSVDHDATVHRINHNWPINDSPGDRPIPVTTVTALIFPEDFPG